MVYAEFGGQTERIMGNWKIENGYFIEKVAMSRFLKFLERPTLISFTTNGIICYLCRQPISRSLLSLGHF